MHRLEWATYHLAVKGLVRRLRQSFPFDLIHAHFVYPDGVVAARLARRFGVPLIITEHVRWRPWLDNFPGVRRRALEAVRESTFQVAVSTMGRDSITHFTGELSSLRIIPDGVDGSVFTLPPAEVRRIPAQVLFVGVVRPVKGVDILLRAMRLLADRGRAARLVILGGSFYENYRREDDRLRQMAHELGLDSRVQFVGEKPLPELVRCMQESAVLVLPSRAESFGQVLVEALACGTPVVATRCGGPEDIVNEEVGVLVPPENPEELARGIEHVLDHAVDYDPVRLREYVLRRFSWETIAKDTASLYREAVRLHGARRTGG
jgi:glycosyltransferase involved in cell wall biosynthesis